MFLKTTLSPMERIGKLAYSRLPSPVYYVLLLLPFLSTGAYLFMQYMQVRQLEDQCALTLQKEEAAFQKKTRSERLTKRYKNPDPYFLSRYLESLCFLQKEQEEIDLRLNHPATVQKHPFQERLAFLQNSNRLTFVEGEIQTSAKIRETEEKQLRSVQMSASDIAHFCSLVEDIPVEPFHPLPDMPQLFFTDFKMKKIETQFYSPVYEVETELLKREIIKP